jgi:hypothetical protein
MGLVKDVKTEAASDDAARAATEGRKVFVFRFTLPTLNYRSSAAVSGAAEVIEAIEARGWALAHVSVHPRFGRGSMIMVFRRS